MSAYPQQPQLPHQPPFVVPPRTTPNFAQFAPLITGFAMLEVINSAPKTPVRKAYADYVSQNNWQNQQFQTLAIAVGQLAELLVATNRSGPNPQHAIQVAAGECAQLFSAVFVQQNQQHFAHLLRDPAAMQQINQLLLKFQQLDQQISQFYQNVNAPAYPPQGHYPPQAGYGHAPQMPMQGNYGGTPVVGNVPSYGGYGGGYGGTPADTTNPLLAGATRTATAPAAYGSGLSLPNVSAPAAPNALLVGGRQGSILESLHMSPQAEAVRQAPAPTPTPREQLVAYVPGQPIADAPAPAAIPAAETLQPAPVQQLQVIGPAVPLDWVKFGSLEWPKVRNVSRPYDAMLTEDGTELQYAPTSQWKLEWSIEHPYPTAYNPDTHVRLLARAPDGTVTEKIVEKNETMKYLDHELDRDAAHKYDASERRDERIGVDMALIASLRSVDAQPISVVPAEAEETEVVDSAVMPVKLAEAILSDTLVNSHPRLNLLLSKNEVPNGVPYEYYVDLVTPKLVPNEQVELLTKLAETDTYLGLASKIAQLEDDDIIELVHDRMTEALNRAIHHNLGLTDWSVGSFVEDYEELVGLFQESYGEDFVRTFEESAVEVIGSALTVSQEERVVNFGMSKLGITPEDMAGTDLSLVCFVTRQSVTELPWSLAELRVALVAGQDASIRASELPELRLALEAVMARTEDLPLVHAHRYLVTSDEQVLELYKGYLAKDAILLGKSELEYSEL